MTKLKEECCSGEVQLDLDSHLGFKKFFELKLFQDFSRCQSKLPSFADHTMSLFHQWLWNDVIIEAKN